MELKVEKRITEGCQEGKEENREGRGRLGEIKISRNDMECYSLLGSFDGHHKDE